MKRVAVLLSLLFAAVLTFPLQSRPVMALAPKPEAAAGSEAPARPVAQPPQGCLAFTSDRPNEGQARDAIWSMAPEGSGLRLLAAEGDWNSHPS